MPTDQITEIATKFGLPEYATLKSKEVAEALMNEYYAGMIAGLAMGPDDREAFLRCITEDENASEKNREAATAALHQIDA
jgi:hypothetical protein